MKTFTYLFVVSWIGLIAAGAMSARAAELVMFESDACEWCEVWHEELGAVYAKTDEGRQAPLRRLDIDDPRPDDLKVLKTIRYTPTFVLMDAGQEVGRIRGYPGESFFWEHLKLLLIKARPAHACANRGPENVIENANEIADRNAKDTQKC